MPGKEELGQVGFAPRDLEPFGETSPHLLGRMPNIPEGITAFEVKEPCRERVVPRLGFGLKRRTAGERRRRPAAQNKHERLPILGH
jgi:hypothetical protein